MKKFLSLVLALVMTMSLVTISAGAKDFTDSSKITYSDAVAVISAVKVVDGYEDGSFNPQGTLTRGAAAKIICNLILGPTTASALSADAAPFKDVPANNNFAGYIAYCAKQGIISGYADGTFKPGNTLTGYAFLKMLLGALGYDAQLEGFVGNNWSIQVAKAALGAGLVDGNDDFNGSKAVTREEACLYAFNTLDADMVNYDDRGSSIIVGGVEIQTGASKAEVVPQTGYKDNMNDGLGVHTLQFAEKYFPNLKKASNTDNFGRPSEKWTLKNDTLCNITKTADATYTKAVKMKDLYKDVSVNSSNTTFNVYIDGEPVSGSNDDLLNGYAHSAGTLTASSSSSTKIGGNGVLVEVYYGPESGDTRTISIINTYIDQIDEYVKKDEVVKIGSMKYATTQFAEDEWVMYTKDADAANDDKIQSMVAAEKQTGVLTKKEGLSKFTIDGKEYEAAYGLVWDSNVEVKDTVDFYLDPYGYVLKVDLADGAISVNNLAYVLDANADRTDYAKLLFSDGTVKTVDVKDSATGQIGDIVSFKNNDGVYKLVTRADTATATQSNKPFTFDKGKPTITVTRGSNINTDSKTVFVYKTATTAANLARNISCDYYSYTGFKSAPSVTAAADPDVKVTSYVKPGKTVATLVVIECLKSELAGTSANLVFIAGDKDAKQVDVGDNITYYQFQAIQDGEIVTLLVNDTDGDTIVANANSGNSAIKKAAKIAVYKDVTVDTDKVSDPMTAAVPGAGNDFMRVTDCKKQSNDVLVLGGVSYATTSNVKVFFVDSAEITAGDISDIRTDDDGITKDPYDTITFSLDNGKVDMIVLAKA